MGKIKIMIVDDSAVVRQTLSRILEESSEFEIVAVAQDPIFAKKKLETIEPDVLVLDIEMPRMDGIEFLKELSGANFSVVICSSQAGSGSRNALSALDYGAAEVIQKPQLGTREFFEESKVRIIDAIKAAHLSGKRPKSVKGYEPSEKLTADVILPKSVSRPVISTTEKIVVVGASTGGTEALKDFLIALPLDSPPVAIVQHMPENFTKAFANRLNSICTVKIKEAENNDTMLRGQALIAPGNYHMLLKRSGARYYVEIKEGPLVSRHRPSVDVLFRSAARYAGPNCIGVIMTGMGDDGARGMSEMHEAGAYTIAQDEATSVVFGMPNEAIKRGGVDAVKPLKAIAETVLVKYFNG